MHYFNVNVSGPVRVSFSKKIHLTTNLDKIVLNNLSTFYPSIIKPELI